LKETFPDLEILVCEDGSTDGTGNALRFLEDLYPELRWFHSDKKEGKGAAIIQGIHQASGKIVAFIDADLSTNPSHIPEFYNQVTNGYDLIIGSRRPKKNRVLKRRIASYFFNLLVRLLFHTKIKDHQCGFKVMKRASIVPLLSHIKSRNFLIDTELIVRAIAHGLKVKEIPIRWQEPHQRQSKVSIIRDGYFMGKSLLELKFSLSF